MMFRSKAPLRIGLAGGGTDVSPYNDLYGGAVLNGTISMFARATVKPLSHGYLVLEAKDRAEKLEAPANEDQVPDGQLDLHKAVYNCIRKDYGLQGGFHLTTTVDAPAGSGLGSSSALVVAMVGAFMEMCGFSLTPYDLAHYAFRIERHYLGCPGGKQDQYAATFGGMNYMEFFKDDKVIVNPLRVRENVLLELENNLLLYDTTTSRRSAAIIEEQIKNVSENKTQPVEAMHHLKKQAVQMKEALMNGCLDDLANILDEGHRYKRRMASCISNPTLEEIYEAAKKAGATGGKISGAGGGGFMAFYCPGTTKFQVIESLRKFGGHCRAFQFVEQGLRTWSL